MNQILKQLFDEDQSDRLNNPNPSAETWNKIAKRDKKHQREVKKMIKKDQLKNPVDFYHAAFIFQHGGTTEDYLKANELAKKSMDLGYEPAKWIYAATMDRYLVSIGKPQKYGTQYYSETWDSDDDWILRDVDPNTTDEERIELGIKPLAEIPTRKPRLK